MHLILLDINNLLCRAYFSNPKLQISGAEVGAIYGLASYVQSLIRMLNPTHIAFVRDLGGKTWRHFLYPLYKAQRAQTEDDLRAQFKFIPILARYLDINLVDMEGFEADDCIATLAHQAYHLSQRCHTTIISSDKDLFQLLSAKLHIYNPHAKKIQTIKDIEVKYEIPFNRFIDYFTLVGDASDNLPGVQGIGPKTALQILQKCDNLDHLDEFLHHFTPAISRKLSNKGVQISLMRRLLLLDRDVKLRIPFCLSNITYFQWHGEKDISMPVFEGLLT